MNQSFAQPTEVGTINSSINQSTILVLGITCLVGFSALKLESLLKTCALFLYRLITGQASNGFSESEFLQDIQKTAEAINAPYSEAVTKTVLKAYRQQFRDNVVLWRATSTDGSSLNYRFSMSRPFDTITPAVQAGLLDPTHPSIKLITSWTNLYPGIALQLCDFDSKAGLAKNWVFLREPQTMDGILDAEGVPETIRNWRSTFRKLGLTMLRFTAVDYHKGSMNLYFVIPGPLDDARITELTALTGAKQPLSKPVREQMKKYLSREGMHFAVTMSPEKGIIERVAFYAIKLPPRDFPDVGSRLETFMAKAPSYDSEKMQIVAWSFGRDGKDYMKMEQSYRGGLFTLLARWGAKFSA